MPSYYVRILSQLDSPEARILDALANLDPRKSSTLSVPEVVRVVSLQDQIQIYLENLVRLGLCEPELRNPIKDIAEAVDRLHSEIQYSPPHSPTVEDVLKRLQEALAWYKRQPYGREGYIRKVRFTRLGRDFVRACRGPQEPQET